MIWRNFTIILSAVMILVVSSCSEYQKLLKSENYELKYEKALEYYEDEDYYKAKNLFEELKNIYKGTERAEKIYYYYAYCLYAEGELALAAYHFRQFAKTYPNSKHTMDAEFRTALCFYDLAPKPSLDQAFTERGIDAFQSFLNKYPNTEYKDTVNTLVDKLHHRLETKSYENAYLYYKIREYKAAITALQNNIEDYPGSPYNEDSRYYILKSWYLYAEGSIFQKQEERYEKTLTAYHKLVDNYPETEYLDKAKKIKEDVENELNN
ncbi:MAG: outer membrane protein assembly factor BamD [Bacteroidota bacterium]